MRVLVLVLALLLAGGLWWLLAGGSTGGDRGSGERTPSELDDPDLRYLTLGSGTLTLWIKTPDRKIPFGAELGIRHNGKTKWLYADELGRRMFSGVPIGTFEAVARAPGYRETVTEVRIEAGVPEERTIMVLPEAPGKPAPAKPR